MIEVCEALSACRSAVRSLIGIPIILYFVYNKSFVVLEASSDGRFVIVAIVADFIAVI